MNKLLSFIFHRRVLVLLLLTAALLLIWVIGPLVAVASWYPLGTLQARLLVSALLVLAVLARSTVRAWRRWHNNQQLVDRLTASQGPASVAPESSDLQQVRQGLTAALEHLRRARLSPPARAGKGAFWPAWALRAQRRLSGRYLYELPWYMIIGAPGSGKTTALRNAGLHFPLAARMGDATLQGEGGTRNCLWWFTDQAVLVDTAGRFTTQDSNPDGDQRTWQGFLAALKQARPRQPLNGVLVTLPVDLLASSQAARQAYALHVTARLQELQQQFRIQLPVYLLVTKCDLLSGFIDTFDSMDAARRALPWGFALAGDPVGSWQARFEPEFTQLANRLDAGLVQALEAEPDLQRRARIYGLPSQFASLRTPLHGFLQQVFSDSAFEACPWLRGVYFVSGTQLGTPIDRVLGAFNRQLGLQHSALPHRQPAGKGYFLQRLMTDVVFAGAGLAGADRRQEHRRQATMLGAYGLVALLAAGSLVAWAASWRENQQLVADMADSTVQVEGLLRDTPNRADAALWPLLGALDAMQALASNEAVAGRDGTAWSRGFGLDQRQQLQHSALQAYERMLREAMLPRLVMAIEADLRAPNPPESTYEALKAYQMLQEPKHYQAAALKRYIHAAWAREASAASPAQQAALRGHLDALLARGPLVAPSAANQQLVTSRQQQLARVPLAQWAIGRLERDGPDTELPGFNLERNAGARVALVFDLASGRPLTDGVPALYTVRGYRDWFQRTVRDVTAALADEQVWVLGMPRQGSGGVVDIDLAVDDVRRAYLHRYRDVWQALLADIRLRPAVGMAALQERARFLSASDSPLIPLLEALSRQTTLMPAGRPADTPMTHAQQIMMTVQDKVLRATADPQIGKRATLGAPGAAIESIVDDAFAPLRTLVTAPEGGKAPVVALVSRFGDLLAMLNTVDEATKAGTVPPTSPLPAQLRNDAPSLPDPVKGLLMTLAHASGGIARGNLHSTISKELHSQVGEFCATAIAGRYPFNRAANKEVSLADFASLFGPGGKFDQMQARLAPYIDTTARPWAFRVVGDARLQGSQASLAALQRAAAIREAFFGNGGGAAPLVRAAFRLRELDAKLLSLTLDVDGQMAVHDHGPVRTQSVAWPGPGGGHQVRVSVEPQMAGGNGFVIDGPWALFRLVDRLNPAPLDVPERLRATFDLDGRRATFDITAGSVRNPFRLAELRGFQCPQGL